jgi:hypothetical protein
MQKIHDTSRERPAVFFARAKTWAIPNGGAPKDIMHARQDCGLCFQAGAGFRLDLTEDQ